MRESGLQADSSRSKRIIIKCRGLVKGQITGSALLMNKAFSFMGDVDMDTSEIIARDHEQKGETIAGKILIYPETKGSSGGCVVLNALYQQGKQPGAIVNLKMADYNLVEGAISAKIPLLCLPERDLGEIMKNGDIVSVDGGKGIIEIIR